MQLLRVGPNSRQSRLCMVESSNVRPISEQKHQNTHTISVGRSKIADRAVRCRAPVGQDEAGRGRVRAGPAEIHAVAQVSLEVRDTVVGGELQHQPLPLRRGLVRHQQHLRVRDRMHAREIVDVTALLCLGITRFKLGPSMDRGSWRVGSDRVGSPLPDTTLPDRTREVSSGPRTTPVKTATSGNIRLSPCPHVHGVKPYFE